MSDTDIIREGASRLREAMMMGRTTLAKIQGAQEQDRQLVKAREYWGDRDDDQGLITRGINLRIAARDIILAATTSAGE